MGYSTATTTSILYRTAGIPTFCIKANKQAKHHADHQLFQNSPKPIRSLAAELMTKEETYVPREDKQGIPRHWRLLDSSISSSPRQLRPPLPSLHNPLLRQQRLGCGWLGVIIEWEGVIVEFDSKLEKQAWLILSKEEHKPPPFSFTLKRIEAMKNEQALSEILCWSRNPKELQRLASRKEEIHQELQCEFYQLREGSKEFISTLSHHKIPIAIVSTRPKKLIKEAVKYTGFEDSFDVIVAAEDVYRGKPDPEMFLFAAQQLNMMPDRSIVFGNSNSSVEAAHNAWMKCVAVAGKHPLYELSAADLVVRQLNELCVVDLKNLAVAEFPDFAMELSESS